MKKPSLKEMSEALELSKTTVSLVLNGRGDEKRIGKDTQERVLKFAKEHNYKANPLARSLSIGKSNTIGLIVPNIADIFFSQIAMRIEMKAEKAGYHVIYSSTGEIPERESKIIQSMLDRKVDGLIIVSSEHNQKDILELQQNNHPFVLVSRNYPDIKLNRVLLDEVEGVASAVDQLVSNGKRKIAFITVSIEIESIKDRKKGYIQTLEKHGLECKEERIKVVDYYNVDLCMLTAIQELLELEDNIDAIIFTTQFLTVAGLKVLKSMNINVPEQIAVVSFGNKEDFELFNPPITSVNLPIIEMGDAAVDLLLEHIEAEKSAKPECRDIVMATELLIRESCGSK